LNYFQQLQSGDLSISAITYAELMNGIKKSHQVEDNIIRLHELAELLEIKPFDQKAAIVYGDFRSALEKKVAL
jgi:tRNA(fMet)-specific endonuclease VapC